MRLSVGAGALVEEGVSVRRICFCDIDHTISDAAWRDPMLGEWDLYHSLSIDDEPFVEMINLLKALSTRWHIVGLTARPEKWRQLTMAWCLKYYVVIDELIMRPNDNFEKAQDFKLAAIQSYIKGLANPLVLVFDDKEEVISAIKAAVPCLAFHVHKGGLI